MGSGFSACALSITAKLRLKYEFSQFHNEKKTTAQKLNSNFSLNFSIADLFLLFFFLNIFYFNNHSINYNYILSNTFFYLLANMPEINAFRLFAKFTMFPFTYTILSGCYHFLFSVFFRVYLYSCYKYIIINNK